MNRIPIKDGKPCTFRVVRVSGTIRKVEEEAIRRAKLLMLAAREQMAGQSTNALNILFGDFKSLTSDLAIVDIQNPDSDKEREVTDDG
jgi:ribonuclease P/MRP protein subunit POP5